MVALFRGFSSVFRCGARRLVTGGSSSELLKSSVILINLAAGNGLSSANGITPLSRRFDLYDWSLIFAYFSSKQSNKKLSLSPISMNSTCKFSLSPHSIVYSRMIFNGICKWNVEMSQRLNSRYVIAVGGFLIENEFHISYRCAAFNDFTHVTKRIEFYELKWINFEWVDLDRWTDFRNASIDSGQGVEWPGSTINFLLR